MFWGGGCSSGGMFGHQRYTKKDSKVSQRAGYAASAFAIALLAVGTAFYGAQGNVPTWMPLAMGFCMVAAACSGVVCLVSALFGHLRNKGRAVPTQGAQPPHPTPGASA